MTKIIPAWDRADGPEDVVEARRPEWHERAACRGMPLELFSLNGQSLTDI